LGKCSQPSKTTLSNGRSAQKYSSEGRKCESIRMDLFISFSQNYPFEQTQLISIKNYSCEKIFSASSLFAYPFFTNGRSSSEQGVKIQETKSKS
jgi:hypothetical protein